MYYAAAFVIAGAVLAFFLNPWLGLPFYIVAGFCIYFFRDPERVPPGPGLMVSPADGKVVSVKQIDAGQTRVSIFLNIFDVHVNRTPIPGVVKEVIYREGKFLNASHEAASADNEQNTLVIEGSGSRVICRQIAGLIARRIVCYKKAGDVLTPAERIGYIKFGSRVDVFFGPEWRPTIRVGERVSAGVSVLAKRTNGAEAI